VTWAARIAVGLGSVLAVACFCVGTDTPVSVTVDDHSYACDDVITSAMLVSGQPASDGAELTSSTRLERDLDARVDATCDRLERRAGWVVWGGIGLGAAVVLAGWTVVREREQEDASPVGDAPVVAAAR
jgi:hypothetical protein